MTPFTSDDRAHEFEELLRPVLDAAYRAAYYLSRNRSDADDLVQEAALLAWRSFDSFERGTNFRAWFHRILTNVFLTRCRSARRHPTVPLDADADDGSDRTLADARGATGSADPASAILSGLALEDVRAALESLPVEYRTVAVLYFVDDLSYEQIATALDCPVGTVRSRLHRGRRMLWQRLRDTAKDFGIRAAG
ncbi:MAG: sigma-70 family RNA polymerase sigma factor [Gemmatimonadales bacterium]